MKEYVMAEEGKKSTDLGVGSRVTHPQFGEGVITGVKQSTYWIHFQERGRVEISKAYSNLEVIERIDADDEMVHVSELEKTLIRVLRRWSDMQENVQLGDKWIGGKMLLQPANPDMQAKEIPIETFFHKIVMVRDRLRVLEQNINSHATMTDEEKVHLQQYITRIYGSLTSFNILFKFKDDYFVGDKKSID
jgi:hypothetical protein